MLLDQKTRQRLYQCKYEHTRKGMFHSCKVAYTKKHRTISGLLPAVALFAWSAAHDQLKAPMGNNAQWAMFSPASFNIYYGMNLPSELPDLQRAAYGTGSGQTSIGLEPTTTKIHAFFPDLCRLTEGVTAVLMNKNALWKQSLEENPFNFVGVKVYY